MFIIHHGIIVPKYIGRRRWNMISSQEFSQVFYYIYMSYKLGLVQEYGIVY